MNTKNVPDANAMWKLALQFRIFEILQISFIGIFSLFYFGLFSFTSRHLLYLGALVFHIASSFFLNDYADWFADQKNPRKILHPKRKPLLYLYLLSSALSLGGAYFISQHWLFLFCTALWMAYSFEPLFLKGRCGFPEVIHFITCFLYAFSGFDISAKIFETDMILICCFWGLSMAAGSLLNEFLDQDADRSAGIKTLGNALPNWVAVSLLGSLHFLALGLFGWVCYEQGRHYSMLMTWAGVGCYLFSFFKLHRGLIETSVFRKNVRWIFSPLALFFMCEEIIRSSFKI